MSIQFIAQVVRDALRNQQIHNACSGLIQMEPASANAPLITSICDASGVVIYLYIATQFLHLTV